MGAILGGLGFRDPIELEEVYRPALTLYTKNPMFESLCLTWCSIPQGPISITNPGRSHNRLPWLNFLLAKGV